MHVAEFSNMCVGSWISCSIWRLLKSALALAFLFSWSSFMSPMSMMWFMPEALAFIKLFSRSSHMYSSGAL